MLIIDTHCHLIDEAFAGEVDAIIKRSVDAGVGKIVLACCDETEIAPIQDLCGKYPGILYPTIGIHPENMAAEITSQLKATKSILDKTPGICAIGEVGIDLHWDKSRLEDQITVLTEQVNWALDLDLPLLLHIRDAMPEFLDLLKHTLYNNARAKGKQIKGILHCYSGTADEAIEAMKYGDFMIGIGGTLTYKKSQVPEVARAIGLEHIVLETDAPYLAPVPNRGKRNEPAYTALTCQHLADIMNCSMEQVADITTHNAYSTLKLIKTC